MKSTIQGTSIKSAITYPSSACGVCLRYDLTCYREPATPKYDDPDDVIRDMNANVNPSILAQALEQRTAYTFELVVPPDHADVGSDCDDFIDAIKGLGTILVPLVSIIPTVCCPGKTVAPTTLYTINTFTTTTMLIESIETAVNKHLHENRNVLTDATFVFCNHAHDMYHDLVDMRQNIDQTTSPLSIANELITTCYGGWVRSTNERQGRDFNSGTTDASLVVFYVILHAFLGLMFGFIDRRTMKHYHDVIDDLHGTKNKLLRFVDKCFPKEAPAVWFLLRCIYESRCVSDTINSHWREDDAIGAVGQSRSYS